MKTVHKYKLTAADNQAVLMPECAELLTVQVQDGAPHLWALVDTDNPIMPRTICVRGTGHPAKDVGRYIGTFQMSGGMLVFHVFDPHPSRDSVG